MSNREGVSLVFRLVTGAVAVLVVTTLESQLLTHVFGHFTALLASAIAR